MGLVLEIGPGGNPSPEVDVLLDRYSFGDDRERRGQKLRFDGRPLVIGDAARLPFGDKVFERCLAFNVVEHFERPEDSLREMSRVAESGLIVAPSPVCELLNPTRPYHRWIVCHEDGELILVERSDGFHITGAVSRHFAGYAKGLNWVWRLFRHEEHTVASWKGEVVFKVLGDSNGRPFVERAVERQLARMKELQASKVLANLAGIAVHKLRSRRRARAPPELDAVLRATACPVCGGKLAYASSTSLLSCSCGEFQTPMYYGTAGINIGERDQPPT